MDRVNASALPPKDSPLEMSLPDASELDILDQLADGYYEIDRAYRYRRVNAAGARLAGRTPAEMVGQHVLELFPAVEDAEIHRAVRRVMEGGGPERIETF